MIEHRALPLSGSAFSSQEFSLVVARKIAKATAKTPAQGGQRFAGFRSDEGNGGREGNKSSEQPTAREARDRSTCDM